MTVLRLVGNTPRSILRFGRFCIRPDERLLLHDDKPIGLGARAFDLLLALASRSGEVVAKDALIAAAWPDTFVDEGNLRVNIAALRRALETKPGGDRCIVNVAGRGYSFVARLEDDEEAGTGRTAHEQHPNTRLIGRQPQLERVCERLLRERFVTITGAGGMGKTTLALAVADEVKSHFSDGVFVVDLSPLGSTDLVAPTVASLLGLSTRLDDASASLLTFLQDKRVLLVLDTCEQVLEGVAPLAEMLLRGARGVSVLATSREPLRAASEWVSHLPPLDLPQQQDICSASNALRFAAVELFVQRTREAMDGYVFDDGDVGDVIALCRRLEGMPLAIELAAAHVPSFGVRGLSQVLDDNFSLVMRGRRTALQRQQTLRSLLDWSYHRLSVQDQLVLRRLSVFPASFSASTAAVLAAFGGISLAAVMESLHELVAKSLVTPTTRGGATLYRLLDMTRAYAREKAVEATERSAQQEHHAKFVADLLLAHSSEMGDATQLFNSADLAGVIDDVRAALDWALSPEGDFSTACNLMIASAPVWFSRLLIEEFLKRGEKVLELLIADSGTPQRIMKLSESVGHARWHIHGPSQEVIESFERALACATELGDRKYVVQALYGLCIVTLGLADYGKSITLAGRLCELVPPNDWKSYFQRERLSMLALHYEGRFEESTRIAEYVLAEAEAVPRVRRLSAIHFDPMVAARTGLARNLWIRGFPDQAARVAKQSVDEPLEAGDMLSLCYALTNAACPVAFWSGDWGAAMAYTAMLLDRTAERAIVHWHSYARGYEAALRYAGMPSITAVRRLPETHLKAPTGLQYDIFATLDYRLATEPLVARGVDGLCEWSAAEMLRVKALRLMTNNASRADIEATLEKAMAKANAQGALSWELRAAITLAEYRNALGEKGAAEKCVRPVYSKFSEGFSSHDLKRAQTLLQTIQHEEF